MPPPTMPAPMTIPNMRFAVLSRTLRARSCFTRVTIVVIRSFCVGRLREEGVVRQFLIVGNHTLSSDELTAAVGERLVDGPAHFYVLVPATPPHDLYGSVLRALEGEPASEQEARAAAAERLAEALDSIRAAGGDADGEVGDADPLAAIAAVLRERHVDEIVVSTLPAHVSKWLRLDLPRRVADTFDLPVTHVVSS